MEIVRIRFERTQIEKNAILAGIAALEVFGTFLFLCGLLGFQPF